MSEYSRFRRRILQKAVVNLVVLLILHTIFYYIVKWR